MEKMGLKSTDNTGNLSSDEISPPGKSGWNAGRWLFWLGFLALICVGAFLWLDEPKRNDKEIVGVQDTPIASTDSSESPLAGTNKDAIVVKKESLKEHEHESAVQSVSETAVNHQIANADSVVAEKPLVPREQPGHDGVSLNATSVIENVDAKQISSVPPREKSTEKQSQNRAESDSVEEAQTLKASVKSLPSTVNTKNQPIDVVGKDLAEDDIAPPLVERTRYPRGAFHPYYPPPAPGAGYPMLGPYRYYIPPTR
uniref:Uncharacterized protein n=1 Tax=Candidatus Kentrum sp. FW TaxID=2126338 RepID=A0A450TAK3_9GAMM|nr:MAG: hypothetical protein BECKFW1821C_GA0114237_100473 [Candidatus Kentron sp. FW]